jgi:hypothetical protein
LDICGGDATRSINGDPCRFRSRLSGRVEIGADAALNLGPGNCSGGSATHGKTPTPVTKNPSSGPYGIKLAKGLGKKGFRAGSLYSVSFNGEVTEISGALSATHPG